jgi:hypothetical protein
MYTYQDWCLEDVEYNKAPWWGRNMYYVTINYKLHIIEEIQPVNAQLYCINWKRTATCFGYKITVYNRSIKIRLYTCVGRDSDSLRAGRSGDRIPVEGKIFRTRPDWPCDLPNFLHNGTWLFTGVKCSGRGDGHPYSSTAKVKQRVELHIYSPSGSSWPVLGWPLPLPLPLYIYIYIYIYIYTHTHTYMHFILGLKVGRFYPFCRPRRPLGRAEV